MRVTLLAPEQGGSCGVLDYSLRLAGTLAESGVRVALARAERGGRLSLSALRAELRATDAQILHIQYPMVRYGASLLPLLAAQLPGVRRVVTLHEFSQAHSLRRLAGLAFSRAQALIFTAEPERAAFCRRYPWSRGRTRVVPLGSNIPAIAGSQQRQAGMVCYFGQLRPHRGLEDFLALVRLATAQAPELRFRVLGAIPPGCGGYAAAVMAGAGDLPALRWELDLPESELAARLAVAEFAYLPYPDGASERRSTLLAALAAGALVITGRGPQTPPGLADAVCLVADPGEALARLRELAAAPETRQARFRAAEQWLRGRDWPSIAAAHRAIYRALIDGEGEEHGHGE
jgi:glycosyltransferase involved in cell wall biosynthesis